MNKVRLFFNEPVPNFYYPEGDGPVPDFGGILQLFQLWLVEHCPDVVEVLFGSPLLIVFELSEDDVFGWSKPSFKVVIHFESLAAGPGPGVQGIVSAKIDVCAKARIMMDDVGVPTLRACELGEKDFGGSPVECGLGKGLFQAGNRFRGKCEDEVDVVRQAGIAIVHRSDRARDHVVETGSFQWPEDDGEKIHLNG